MTPQEWRAEEEAMSEEERKAYNDHIDEMYRKRDLLMYALPSLAEGFTGRCDSEQGVTVYHMGNVSYQYKQGDEFFTELEWEPINGKMIKPPTTIYFSDLLRLHRLNELKDELDEFFELYQ